MTESAHLYSTRMISLEGAKQMAVAAEQEAVRNGWKVAIAVVDGSGELILLHRLDGTQLASMNIATGKARTAIRFKRPTKALEETVAGGRQALLSLPGVTAVEGGLPIVAAGRVVGAVGVSGMQSAQDSQVAEAGLGAFRPG